MYGLEKFGITVIKPSNCFASRVERFQIKDGKSSITTEKLAITPGPGSYNNQASWLKPQKLGPKPEWS